VEELGKLGREDIMVVVGGVIPAQDYDYLKTHGAAAIFGPGTVIPVAAQKVLDVAERAVGGVGARLIAPVRGCSMSSLIQGEDWSL